MRERAEGEVQMERERKREGGGPWRYGKFGSRVSVCVPM